MFPLLANRRSSCCKYTGGIVPVFAHPAGSRPKREGLDLLIQAGPGEAIDRLQAVVDRGNLCTQPIQLLTASLTGQGPSFR